MPTLTVVRPTTPVRRPPVRETDRERSHISLRDRYDPRGAIVHPGGIGEPPASRNVDTRIVAIEDPIPDHKTGKKGRLFATVNRLVDILEMERSQGYRDKEGEWKANITDEAYCAGRMCQAVYEKARGPTLGHPRMDGSHVDAEVAKEAAMIRAIDNAFMIQAHLDAIRWLLGMIDARIIEAVLRDHKSYAAIAAERGRAGERGQRYFAARFRDALEALAEARASDRYTQTVREALERLQDRRRTRR